MKTVTVRVVGGLGNQMHCYAFGRAIAAQNQAELTLDAESGFWNDPYRREYLLDRFSGLVAGYRSFAKHTETARLFFKCGLRLGAVCSQWLPVSRKWVVVEKAPWRYRPDIHHARYAGNPYFMGYWASYRYYEDIEQELRRELKPPLPEHPSALELLSRIQSCRSCFIHWRSYGEEKSAHPHDLNEYYRRAVKVILEKYPDIVFFVFSDDPVKAREAVSSPEGKTFYVNLPALEGNARSLTDFYLMYSCDHAIIGDSTFSWWAAWLSEHEHKMVIAPKGLAPWGEDWASSRWASLDID